MNGKKERRRWHFNVPEAKAKRFEDIWPSHDTSRTAALLKGMELYVEKEASA